MSFLESHLGPKATWSREGFVVPKPIYHPNATTTASLNAVHDGSKQNGSDEFNFNPRISVGTSRRATLSGNESTGLFMSIDGSSDKVETAHESGTVNKEPHIDANPKIRDRRGSAKGKRLFSYLLVADSKHTKQYLYKKNVVEDSDGAGLASFGGKTKRVFSAPELTIEAMADASA